MKLLSVTVILLAFSTLVHGTEPTPGHLKSSPQPMIWYGVPTDVKALCLQLNHPDPEVRCEAAEKLGRMGSHADEAIDRLAALFDDDKEYVKKSWQPNPFGSTMLETVCPAKSAAIAISCIGGDRAIETLKTWGEWGDAKHRFWSVYTLNLIDPKLVTPVILDSLASVRDSLNTGWYVESALIDSFAVRKDKKAVHYLLGIALDKSSHLREEAIRALGQIGDPKAVEPLIGLLGKDQIGMTAAHALGSIGDPRALDPLIKLTSDKSNYWERPIGALSGFSQDKALYELLGYLKEDELLVRMAAAQALGILGKEEAVPGLIAAMNDTCAEHRRFCILSLGEIGGDKAFLGLYKASREDPDQLNRWRATDMLDKLAGVDYLKTPAYRKNR